MSRRGRKQAGFMMASFMVATLGASGSLAAEPASVATAAPRPAANGGSYHWDLNVDGALGTVLERDGLVGLGRIRTGLLFIHEPADPRGSPLFISLGPSYEISNLSLATIGLQAELTHIRSGFWLQGGALLDVVEPSPGWMAAAGWSLFGAEVQRRILSDGADARLEGPAAWVVYGKLRVPVSIMLRAFSQ